MKIDWNQSACGLSLLEIRNLIRSVDHWGRITSVSSIARRLEPRRPDYSLSLVQIEQAREERALQARRLLAMFAASGLIELPTGEGMLIASRDHHPGYGLTPDAFGLMRATKAKRITRKAADAAVGKLREAIDRINSDPVLMYDVEQVCLYGSYLTDSPDLGDVDVAFSLSRRWDGPEEFDAMRAAFERVHEPPRSQVHEMRYRYDWNARVVKKMLRPKACIQLTDMYHMKDLGCAMREIHPHEREIPPREDYDFERGEIILIEDDGSALARLEEEIEKAIEDKEAEREAARQKALSDPDDPAHEVTKELAKLQR